MKEANDKRSHVARFHSYEMTRTDQYIEVESRLVAARVWRKREGLLMGTRFAGGGGVGFKWVNFMIHELHFNKTYLFFKHRQKVGKVAGDLMNQCSGTKRDS